MDPQQETNEADLGPWWMRTLARGIATIGAGIMAVMGIVTVFGGTITLATNCMAAGVISIAVAFIVAAIEAPVFFQFIEFVRPWSEFWNRRPYWLKAAMYITLPLICLFMCIGATQFIAIIGVLVSGMLYGMLALGKKADRDTMARSAGTDKNPFANDQVSPAPTV